MSYMYIYICMSMHTHTCTCSCSSEYTVHVWCCSICRSGSVVVELDFGLPMPAASGFIEGLFYASFDDGVSRFMMTPESDVTVQAFDGSAFCFYFCLLVVYSFIKR